MRQAIADYFATLTDAFGTGWNRFWFTPSNPVALARLRLATGMVALYVHVTYSFDLVRWFGPRGMLPADTVQQFTGTSHFSYLHAITDPTLLWTVHLVGLVVLVLFTAGLFTRVTSVLALVVTLSTIHRAPMLTGEFEPILTMVMCYVCLGPSGARLSLDRRRALRRGNADPLDPSTEVRDEQSWGATVAVRLVQVHLALIYWMMALGMLSRPGGVWWTGDAMWWLVAVPDASLVDLTWLHDHLYLLNAWSHAIVLFELVFPILIWNRLARPLLLALSVPLWLSLALATGQVPFCLMMLIAGMAFVGEGARKG